MTRSPTEWMILPLRRYAQFTGRARRAEYWWFILFGVIVSVVASIVDALLGAKTVGVGTIVSLGLLIPQLAVGVRRLHDIGRSGWWLGGAMLLGIAFGIAFAVSVGAALVGVRTGNVAAGIGAGTALLGIIGLAILVYAVVLLVWACQPGTAGPNRFGPDPLDID